MSPVTTGGRRSGIIVMKSWSWSWKVSASTWFVSFSCCTHSHCLGSHVPGADLSNRPDEPWHHNSSVQTSRQMLMTRNADTILTLPLWWAQYLYEDSVHSLLVLIVLLTPAIMIVRNVRWWHLDGCQCRCKVLCPVEFWLATDHVNFEIKLMHKQFSN